MRRTVPIAAFLLLVFLVSCADPAGEAGVRLNIETPQIKDLDVPAPQTVSSYRYSARRAGEERPWTDLPLSGGGAELRGLVPGEWTFSVRAYSSSGILLYEGSESTVLRSGSITSVNVVLNRVYGSGTGKISMSIRTPIVRGRSGESLVINYRRIGEQMYSNRIVSSSTASQGERRWEADLNSLSEGMYELSVSLHGSSGAVLGRTFTTEVRSGKTTSVSGNLDGGVSQDTHPVTLKMSDIITLAENENCTGIIVGLRDTLTGEDIGNALTPLNGTYTLKYCPFSSISPDMSLSSVGIEAQVYTFAGDPDGDTLRTKHFVMITKSCSVLPSRGNWFKGQPYGSDEPQATQVRTLYVNKNVENECALSNLPFLTRLIFGHDMTKITGDDALSQLRVLPVLSIPPNVTQIGEYAVLLYDCFEDMVVHFARSQSQMSHVELEKKPRQTVRYGSYLGFDEL